MTTDDHETSVIENLDVIERDEMVKDDDEDLDAILANMDIEKDFNSWTSFRGSMDSIENKTDTEVILGRNGDTTIQLHQEPKQLEEDPWKYRLQREEIFSVKYYRVSAAEEQELKQIEIQWGIKSASRRLLFGRQVVKLTDQERSMWNAIARPENEPNLSVLIKRGWLMLRQQHQQDTSRECELVLLTRGFAMALTTATDSNDKEGKSVIPPRKFHCAFSWSDVDFIRPRLDNDQVCTFQIELGKRYDQETLILQCATPSEQDAWMQALEIILVRYHTHHGHRPDLGWQYLYIYRPGFTVAVTNRTTDLLPLDLKNRNQLDDVDDYNGYAPLHYAVKHNHVPAIVGLLEAGATVDIKNKDGHTANYLAVQDELPSTTIALLQQHGAEAVDADVSQRGELFGQVTATEERVIERRQREESERQRQHQQAEAASVEMRNNIKLLQQRGEKINEIGDKSSLLNDGAADFASMAKQLKEAQKKKRWYHL